MEAILLRSARLAVEIRKEYPTWKKDPSARYYTYVLLLQHSKIYIGNTDNIYTRLMDHRLMGPSAAQWVQKHGPVVRIIEIARNCSANTEKQLTLAYMAGFGVQNVRGASYCRPDLAFPPADLAGYCKPPSGFSHAAEDVGEAGKAAGDSAAFTCEYLSRQEIDAVWQEVEDMAHELRFCSGSGSGGG